MIVTVLTGLLVMALAALVHVERQRRAIARDVVRDRLTGLAGRGKLVSRLEVALVRAERRRHTVGVLVVDVNRFRAVNERYGSDVGDRLLAELATLLEDCAREEDTFARLAGDQFAVLLEELADPTAAVRVTQRMLEAVEGRLRVGDLDLDVDITVGVATGGGGTDGDQDLLGGAEQALRAAKLRGSSYELFRRDMRAESRQQLRFEEELVGAADRGELFIELQPVMTIEAAEVHGLEALVRWEHPRLGRLPPGSFIPVAEQTGAIIELGAWVLREACRAVQRLHARNPTACPPWISVNVSAHQLWRGAAFVDEVRATLAATRLDPRRLVLEITEGTLIQADLDTTRTTLTRLRELGVQLAIDDFGTGYSSLAYLAGLPVTIIKIDRSFVAGLDRAPMPAIVEGVLGIADALGAVVVAEGIETPAQARVLRTLGCPLGQGFWLGRPTGEHHLQPLLADTDRSEQMLDVSR